MTKLTYEQIDTWLTAHLSKVLLGVLILVVWAFTFALNHTTPVVCPPPPGCPLTYAHFANRQDVCMREWVDACKVRMR